VWKWRNRRREMSYISQCNHENSNVSNGSNEIILMKESNEENNEEIMKIYES